MPPQAGMGAPTSPSSGEGGSTGEPQADPDVDVLVRLCARARMGVWVGWLGTHAGRHVPRARPAGTSVSSHQKQGPAPAHGPLPEARVASR